ncbi:MAG: hypothetical protein INR69_04950 [Mucilaginibacter polytrichastri]|nr:hypothetical protein [Mucilaginibacter polytrichastri]
MGIEAQIAFLNRIKLTHPAHQLFAGQIADILGIGLNEAYKKISGKSFLSLEQISMLCKAYNTSFSINEIEGQSQVTFNYSAMKSSSTHIETFLDGLEREMQALVKMTDAEIITTTDDIPLFHLFRYPQLSAFKFYFWRSQVVAEASSASEPFTADSISEDLIRKAARLHELYRQVPSTEIWTYDTLLGTLSQLQYVYESNLIEDKELLFTICDQLKQTLRDVNIYATRQSKGEIDNPRAEFNWYTCDLNACITYLIRTKDTYAAYHRFNTFNYLRTTDAVFCQEVENWMKNIMEKSISFTRQGQKQRNNYVKSAIERCDEFTDLIRSN